MIIRDLKPEEIKKAVEIKMLCWTEELAGQAENTVQAIQELEFWMMWLSTAEKNNDVRLFVGAFDEDMLMGAAAASFIGTKDTPEEGIELNGLWVDPRFRGLGVSISLFKYVLECFMCFGVHVLVVYNHHDAPSNAYFRKLGGKVIRQELQLDDKLLIDIFQFDINNLYQCFMLYDPRSVN